MKDTPPLDEILDDATSEDNEAAEGEVIEEKEKTLDEMTEEELLDKVLEYRAMSQRLAADYQNLKKEADVRVANARKYGTEALISEIAPLVDYFDSAFSTVPEEEMSSSWMVGIKYIQDHLLKVLKDNNVELIESVGKEFNPELHEAVSEEESEEVKSHYIIRQSQSGFLLNGKCIRPAKVVVAK